MEREVADPSRPHAPSLSLSIGQACDQKIHQDSIKIRLWRLRHPEWHHLTQENFQHQPRRILHYSRRRTSPCSPTLASRHVATQKLFFLEIYGVFLIFLSGQLNMKTTVKNVLKIESCIAIWWIILYFKFSAWSFDQFWNGTNEFQKYGA